MADLEHKWLRLARSQGADAAAAARWWSELSVRYSEPHRHYHTLDHIAEFLSLLEQFELEQREHVEAAVWFHDVIYDTHRNDNEARSAELAGSALRELKFQEIDIVQAMINATASHEAASLTAGGELFLDADLSILGAPPERYLAYAAAIRDEYAWVPPPQFAVGRASILRRLAGRPSIFRTGEMRERFEQQARANVAAELETLEQDDRYSRSR